MKRARVFFWSCVTAIGCVVLSSQLFSAVPRSLDFEWLSPLPLDEFYSTKSMGFYGNRGVIVKENSVLISSDQGRSWVRLKESAPSLSTASAWLTPSLDLLRLFDGIILVGTTSDREVKRLPLQQSGVTYLSTAATETLQHMFVVGGKSVVISAQRLDTLPHYAEDTTSASPRMFVPAILVSSDRGQTWRMAPRQDALGYLDSVNVVANDVITWGPYAVYASLDAGKSWTLLNLNIPVDEEEAYPVSAVIVAQRAYVSLKNGRVLSGEVASGSLNPLVRLPSAVAQLTFTGSCIGFGISSSATDDGDALTGC